jgi:DNA-binding response OmpR family regulator
MNESPKRVLVMDNDPDVLDSVKFLLKIAGYKVLLAAQKR